ncbi:hypothetical protein [Bradyrhizobium sp. JYMT SZCCT0428]|uniref:hypothetical protein n=1 Tax=Bradyrhizobium sp. JYMT SZCCT0428 TaxID=2807673 RepID=UPI001BA9C5EE|nr:hypothetical protein [Bradyrhizobium sp. JYMT SZCCT0428]MBR1154662.1 hypothetical protein [Bradyrhizobium sp. JYMT SZCCT0428]
MLDDLTRKKAKARRAAPSCLPLTERSLNRLRPAGRGASLSDTGERVFGGAERATRASMYVRAFDGIDWGAWHSYVLTTIV